MPITTLAKSVITAFTCLLLLTGMAEAGVSKAFAKDPVTLHTGPGTRYDATSTLPAGTPLDIERCTALWCLIAKTNQHGWVSRASLTFGNYPRGFLSGRKLDLTLRGPGTVCFYTGTRFTGRSLCARSGEVMSDLALVGYDNAFQSVKVTGKISVQACRDFYFSSWCETISADQPVLNRYLRRGLSSYRVW